MSEKKNNIDNLFEQGLKGYEEKAPAHSWDVLDAKLDKQKKMRYMRMARYAAASVLILLAFFLGQEYSTINDRNKNLVAASETTPPTTNQSDVTTKPLSLAPIHVPAEQEATTQANLRNSVSSQMAKQALAQQKNIRKPITEAPISLLKLADIDRLATKVTDVLQMPESYLRDMLEHPDQELIAAAEPQPVVNARQAQSWELGGFFAPVYSYRTTENQSFGLFDNSYKSNTNGPGSFEQGQIAFAAGITAQFNVNKRWTVESGLFYSRMGQAKNTLVFQNKTPGGGDIQLSTSAGRIDGSKLPQAVNTQVSDNAQMSENPNGPEEYITTTDMDMKLHQQFDFIEIPMLVKYEVFHEEVAINLISGLTTGVLVNNSSYLDIEGNRNKLGSTKNLRKFLYSSVVGFGMQYEIRNGLFLNLEPTFKYALHSMNPSNEYKYKPYSLGINTGVSFGF